MSETSTTATLVGTPSMLAPGANVLTATLPRGEIEDALALDPPAELILDVLRRPEGSDEVERKSVSVIWTKKDLESVLEDREADAFTFWFDPVELESAIEGSEVEGHGIRETAAVLTIAAAAAAAGASGAFGAVAEGTVTSERSAQAGAPAIHTEMTLTERGIDTGTPAASHDETTLTARGIDTGSPAVHDEATLTARGIDPGTPPARHDEATLAARGIETGDLVPSTHDERTFAARGLEPATVPATTDGGSGFEMPTVDPATAAGFAGALAGAGLLIAAAAFATRRREPGTV